VRATLHDAVDEGLLYVETQCGETGFGKMDCEREADVPKAQNPDPSLVIGYAIE
jgi:hypothetical protein